MTPSEKNELIAQSSHQDRVPSQKEALLKALIGQVDPSEPDSGFGQSQQMSNQVIFESDIDGVRYLLVRSRHKSDRPINLSPREQAIAKLVAKGLPNKSIGNQLDISRWTVATHLRRMFIKLEVSSRTAMITRLLEENLLHQD